MADILAEMSERVLGMGEVLQEQHDLVKKIDKSTGSIVSELPRLRRVAYGALLISLVTALSMGWVMYKLQPLLDDDPPAHRP